MPYLHFDLPRTYDADRKRRLAADLGRLYADVMQTRPSFVTVAFRELGPGNVVRCDADPPRDIVVIQCDIRRGRPLEQRERLAREMVALAATSLDWPQDAIILEYTIHAGDESFEDGEIGFDWTPEEASAS